MSRQLILQRTLSALKQGGTLTIRSRVPCSSILIQPSWRDDAHLTIFQLPKPSTSSLQQQQQQQQQRQSHNDGGEEKDQISKVNVSITQQLDKITSMGRSETHMVVELDPIMDNDNHDDDDYKSRHFVSMVAHVPEKMNLFCQLENGGDIRIDNKLEGDVDLKTSLGDILLTKVRGYHIALHATGTIYASDVLEAQSVSMTTEPGRVRAKRIHGSQVDIRVNHKESVVEPMEIDDEGAAIDISSLYVGGSGSAELVATSSSAEKTSIRCKSHHGHVNAQANHRIEFGGVNGSFDIDCDGEASIHIDSLAPGSISIVSAQQGIFLTMDRKLEADLRLLSGVGEVRDVARSALLENDASTMEQGLRQYDESLQATTAQPISVVTTAFTEVPLESGTGLCRLRYVQGYVDNRSREPDSRFEQKGGKIRLQGAANQALQGFSASSEDPVRPLVIGASVGRIAVESLSWLGAISRRYGLDENERRPDLGRQATRRGRPLVEVDDQKSKE